MRSQATAPPAAPAQGAAPAPAGQAARIQVAVARIQAQQAAARCRSCALAPALLSEDAQWEPQNDPGRWQGFL